MMTLWGGYQQAMASATDGDGTSKAAAFMSSVGLGAFADQLKDLRLSAQNHPSHFSLRCATGFIKCAACHGLASKRPSEPTLWSKQSLKVLYRSPKNAQTLNTALGTARGVERSFSWSF
jgi:hypothetical protein